VETTLSWIAFSVGVAGVVIGLLFGRRRETTERATTGGWLAAVIAVAATLVLYLVTRPDSPPFALGHRLGYGALIGGLISVIAGLWLTLGLAKSRWASGVSVSGLFSLILVGVSLIFLLFGDYPQPALAGFIIAVLASAIIFRLVADMAEGASILEMWSLVAVAVAATVMLGVFRYDSVEFRFWWRAPLMVLCATIVAHLLASSTAKSDKSYGFPSAITSIVALGLVAVFAWKVFPDWGLFRVSVAGVVTLLIVAALGSAISPRFAAIAAVLATALSALAFGMLGGFGVGTSLLAACAVALPVSAASLRSGDDDQDFQPMRALLPVMFILGGVVMFRLFIENYTLALSGLDTRAHYTMIAVVAGAVFPFVLLSFFQTSIRGLLWKSSNALAAGVFAAATPLLILVVFGAKAVLGFVVGTIAAEVFLLFLSMSVAATDSPYSGSLLLVLASQASAVFLSSLSAPLNENSRKVRIIILLCATLVGVLWSWLAYFLSRREQKEG
jgi:hypothetical protein